MFIKKNEKFGIRKYKFGAASVLLGTCLAIGLSASGEAKASETTNEETKIDSKHIDSNNQNSVAESENNTSNEVATSSEITAPNDTSLNVNDGGKTESINNDKKREADKTLEIEDNTKLEASSQEDINDRNENAKLDTISDDKAANSDQQTSSNSVPSTFTK